MAKFMDVHSGFVGVTEDQLKQAESHQWIAPGILEALIPGRMQSHACTAEIP